MILFHRQGRFFFWENCAGLRPSGAVNFKAEIKMLRSNCLRYGKGDYRGIFTMIRKPNQGNAGSFERGSPAAFFEKDLSRNILGEIIATEVPND